MSQIAVDAAGYVTLTGTETLTNKTVTTPTITLAQGSAPSPTAEGDIQWDTDDDRLIIGDGSSAVTIAPNIGQHTVYIPASSMVATTTNGADGPVTEELATNDVMAQGLEFDAATEEHAQFSFQMPKGWDEGTIIVQFLWMDAATAGSGDVIWGIECGAFGDSDALDAAFGTAVTVTDTFLTANDIHISSETSAITAAGTPAEEDFLICQTYRKAADGSDTYTQDARLLGVRLHYTVDAGTDS
jgi:hypothetical protein